MVKDYFINRMYLVQSKQDDAIYLIEGYFARDEFGNYLEDKMHSFHSLIEYALTDKYSIIYIFYPDDKGEANFVYSKMLNNILTPSKILKRSYLPDNNVFYVDNFTIPKRLVKHCNQFTVDLLIKNFKREYNTSVKDKESETFDCIKNKLLSAIDIQDILE